MFIFFGCRTGLASWVCSQKPCASVQSDCLRTSILVCSGEELKPAATFYWLIALNRGVCCVLCTLWRLFQRSSPPTGTDLRFPLILFEKVSSCATIRSSSSKSHFCVEAIRILSASSLKEFIDSFPCDSCVCEGKVDAFWTDASRSASVLTFFCAKKSRNCLPTC